MKKKIIWIVVALVLLIVAIIGGLYLTTDLFKSPQQLFYKYFADSFSFLGKTSYEDFMTQLKTELEGSMEIEGEVTASVLSDDESIKELGTVLEKGKIIYNMKTVGKEQKMQSDITLNYNGNNIVTLNVLKNKEQYGIKIAEAYEKYISVENNNLKALFQKIGLDTTEIPDRIETVDCYELLNIDQETLNNIKTTYSKVITQNIPKECYSVEKNITTYTNSGTLTTNAYKLTLTEEQVKTILVKVFETLKTDDKTLNLIIDKYYIMTEPYKNMNKEIDVLTKEKLVMGIEDTLTDLKEMNATSKEALKIVVYAAKDNSTKIEVIALEDSKQLAEMNMEMVKNESNNGIVITYSEEDSTIKMIMNYNDTKQDVVMSVESEGTTVEVSIKEEIKATDNVKVEDFNSDNSVKLNDMTETEMGQLVQVIYTNVMKVLPEKMRLLGIDTSGLNNAA